MPAVIVRTVGDVLIAFSDRKGGVSHGSYRSLNLGDHVGDAPEAVAENRARLRRLLPVIRSGTEPAFRSGTEPAAPPVEAWVWLRQVHGDRVIVAADEPRTTWPRAVPDADAAVTDRADLPLVVLTADCAPVALVAAGAIGVVHAGWPGLEAGVIGRAVTAMRELVDGPVQAILGPCVHPARYEFGADLLTRLVDRLGPTVASRTASGALALDIPAAVGVALREAGVDRLDDVGVCTAESADHFSYRRDGTTGRQAVVVMRQSASNESR